MIRFGPQRGPQWRRSRRSNPSPAAKKSFRLGYEPVKCQFGGTAFEPWHDTMQANDKYRRDSLDGGTTWGNPYQFKGTDGSDANVSSYITRTKITAMTIESPKIYGAEIHGVQFFDYGGGFSFISPSGSNWWGSITHETDGIHIGAVDGIILDAGDGVYPRAVDHSVETNATRIITEGWLQANPTHAVFA